MTGRRHHNPLGLPGRVYWHHGAFCYVDRAGHWHRLGKQWDKAARIEWARLSGGEAERGTVAELLDAFLVHVRALVAAGKRAPRTVADNEVEAENLKRSFGHMQQGKLRRKHVAGYLEAALEAKRGVRANREVGFLSSAYSWGGRKVGLEENPCYGVRRNTETPRERSPEGWELRKFGKDYCPPWLRCYVLLKHLTGCRQGDLLALMRDAGTSQRLVTKEGKKRGRVRKFRWTWALRTVWNALLAIKRVKDDKVAPAYVFITSDGSPITRFGFKSAWQRAMNKWVADGHERFTEHDIRSRTANDAGTVEDAQAILGDGAAIRVYRRGAQNVKPLR